VRNRRTHARRPARPRPRALFVGGTPLYLMAFFKGMMQGPGRDDALRARLEAREAAQPGCLHAELSAARSGRRRPHPPPRPAAAGARARGAGADRQADQRASRTTSIAPAGSARAASSSCTGQRDDLHARVKLRTEAMLAQGLLAETEAIERSGGFSLTAGRDRLRRVPRLPARPLQGPGRAAQQDPSQHAPADPPADHLAAAPARRAVDRRRARRRRAAESLRRSPSADRPMNPRPSR
jgi:hypothetical protein